MRKISIVCVGNLKEKFWTMGALEFEKRLSKFCDLEIFEITEEKFPQKPSKEEIEKALEEEAKKILQKTKGKKTFCLCIEGKQVSSEEFSKILSLSDDGPICFVVGSSFGLSKTLKRQFPTISFGKITLPHQLFRVILMEQIYRGMTILNNVSYHK